mmetsp:Transcript_28167/g.77419  ORF Transcript_28167/g.77419 Transcript_28167/m.77419 type:complete len:193 (+) Transcript_28167:162-740(+)
MMSCNQILFLAAAMMMCITLQVAAFTPTQQQQRSQRTTISAALAMAKGFGATPEKTEKSQGQVKREQERSKYDEIAATGGQEYNIFVRQFGSDDQSWLPCGAIAVPRAAQVSDAVYANTQALESGIVRTYPKLKGYEAEFEYGYNLKVFPDDPIEVAVKNGPKSTGMSFGNWVSTLLSPVDASKVPPPPTSS